MVAGCEVQKCPTGINECGACRTVSPSDVDTHQVRSGIWVPQRVCVKPQAWNDPQTAEIIKRVQGFVPGTPITRMRGQKLNLRSDTSARWRWRRRQGTLVLGHRVAPFLTTFPSPGAIVERMGVTLNLAWHCPYDCSFCYLQAVRPADHMLYTNLEQMISEVEVERFAYPAALTLWTLISFSQKGELTRVPDNFFRAANYLRGRFIREGIASDEDAIKLLRSILNEQGNPVRNILTENDANGKLKVKDLKVSRTVLAEYYRENRKRPVRLNTSEFTDMLGLDPLCGYSKVVVDLVDRMPELEIGIRSKSAYMDELLLGDGCGRIGVGINFNSEHVIREYEHGTSSLDDRIQAAVKIQEARGFRLRVVMEPIIKYEGYEEDYSRTVRKIMEVLDPNRVEEVAMSYARYSGRLIGKVRRNFPDTDLFDESHGLSQLASSERHRYPIEERVALYKRLHLVFREYTDAMIRVGGEVIEVWDKLGWDRSVLFDRSVYQYPGLQSSKKTRKGE